MSPRLVAVRLDPPVRGVASRHRITAAEVAELRAQGVPVAPCLDAVRLADPLTRRLGAVVLDPPGGAA
jgi:hypothetical protein